MEYNNNGGLGTDWSMVMARGRRSKTKTRSWGTERTHKNKNPNSFAPFL